MDSGCQSEKCDGLAARVVYWPGQTLRLCMPCTVRATALAQTMGFALDSRPIEAKGEL